MDSPAAQTNPPPPDHGTNADRLPNPVDAPASKVSHLSLEGMHGSVALPPAQPRGSGGSGGRSSGRPSWSASGTWTRATGAPIFRAARSSSTACSGWSPLASLMAIFLQVISARLGVVTGKDLAQCCRDWYPAWTRWPNWLLCELAIGACDLAEVLGSAVAHQSAVPHPAAVGGAHHRLRRAAAAGAAGHGHAHDRGGGVWCSWPPSRVCYFIEIFVLPQTRPSFLEMGHAPGPRPGFRQARHAVRGDRHHRRDRDAAQPLPALGAGADAGSSSRTTPPSAAPSGSTPSTPSWRCRSPSSSTPRFSSWRRWSSTARPASTVPGGQGRLLRPPTATGSASPT